jgi:catechol 2,3-dioxygenase-like lactoylglutathione lyase family enzyme
MSITKPSASHSALELGWFTLCLKAGKYKEMLDFYRKLGFKNVGGQPEHGWATLANGATELAVMSFLQSNLINFRGGPIATLAAELERRGFHLFHQTQTDPTSPEARVHGPRSYDPAKWPAEFHTGKDGNLLSPEDAGDFLIEDPDGHLLLFDTVPVERMRYQAGDRFASDQVTGAYDEGQLRLGRFVLQLHVKDPAASRAFYERLGLHVTKEVPELGYVEMANDLPVPCTIGLNAKSAPCDVLCFDCEDLDGISASLVAQGLVFEMSPRAHPDGARIAMLRDPEGNTIFFRQPPRP